MAGELAPYDAQAFGDMLEFASHGIDSVCEFFGNIIEEGSDIIQSGIDYADKRAAEQYQLQVQNMQLEERRIQGQVQAAMAAAREATEQKRIEMEARANELSAEVERLKIMEQSKCFQHALDVAQQAYNRKIDFYQAQLKSCDDFFRPQIAAMQEEIKFLENKKDTVFNDPSQYTIISKRLDRISDYCRDVNNKYLKFHDSLTAAVKIAQLDNPMKSANLGYSNTNYLENK